MHKFWVIGINYKKTDTCVRGSFAVNPNQYDYLLSIAPDFGVKELFILSTCNRTEIYGVAENANQLIDLLCQATTGNTETFINNCYQKNDAAAIEHLFHVAAGLDSQILGDFEILGQIKLAIKHSKSKGYIGTFLERLINSVLQSTKAIKTNTSLSSGTVSVSFAAIQYIRESIKDIKDKKIVLVGTGKIGRSTCKNIIHYLGTNNITLINRTEETAIALAEELSLNHASFDFLDSSLADADIIIVSTNAPEPVVTPKNISGKKSQLIIDLSVPCNVDYEVRLLQGIELINVDALSKIKDETLESRRAEVPKALSIINDNINEFNDWCTMRKNVPVLKEVKSMLKAIQIPEQMLSYRNMNSGKVEQEDKIQQVINVMATKMRRNNAHGCYYIEAINDFIAHNG